LRLLTLSLLLLLASSCGEREDLLLLGSWQAVSVLEAGDSLRLDPTEVGFDFAANNRYNFRSTLRYTEAGTWRYADGFLFARDTTRPANEERVVAVEQLTADSLAIRMLADGKERELLFLRER
jgi:hypothetical protein